MSVRDLRQFRRRLFDEPLHQRVVMLGGVPAEQIADLQVGEGIPAEPVGAGMFVHQFQQFIQQAGVSHAFAQAQLVRGQHEGHLVDQQVGVVRIIGAAQA
jgi:hypothetical protein